MNCTVTSACIGCGLCTVTCPQIFRMTGEGRSEVYESIGDGRDTLAVKEAMTACPVNAIREERT